METVHRLMLGSTNDAKIRGVQAACEDVRDTLHMPDLSQPTAWTCQVDSGVSDHPWGFPATVEGAQNRAHAAYQALVAAPGTATHHRTLMGIGVESGFIEVTPAAFTLYNFDVCALFDGRYYYLGLSPGFEYPRRLVENIFLHRQPFQEARQYISAEDDIERGVGLIGVLAGGHTDRPEMTRLCTRLALVRYVRRREYEQWQ